jgi:hypothetical protein
MSLSSTINVIMWEEIEKFLSQEVEPMGVTSTNNSFSSSRKKKVLITHYSVQSAPNTRSAAILFKGVLV